MDLFEFENLKHPGLWDEESIEKVRKTEPNECTGTALSESPDEYYCWQGVRIPCWFE